VLTAACGGGAGLRAEDPARLPAGTVAHSRAPGPRAAEPDRHAAVPANLDSGRRRVLDTHRVFWDALIPPDSEAMRPRWEVLSEVAEPAVVAMYRDSFNRDSQRDGGAQLLIDLRFRIDSVRVAGDFATVDGCLEQQGVIRRSRDATELGRDSSRLAYAAVLVRVSGQWRFHAVSVEGECAR